MKNTTSIDHTWCQTCITRALKNRFPGVHFAVRRLRADGVSVWWHFGPTEDEVRAAFGDENDRSIQCHIKAERLWGPTEGLYMEFVADCLRNRHPNTSERASRTFAYLLIDATSFPTGAGMVGIEPSGRESVFLHGKYRLRFLV